MRKRMFVGSTLMIAVALSFVLRAQAPKMAHAEMTYVGCEERSSTGGLNLTHVMQAEKMAAPMPKESMPKDSTPKDSMPKASMTTALGLSSTSVDLAKHVGQKVSIKGA